MPKLEQDYFTVEDLAKELKVSISAVEQGIKSGKIKTSLRYINPGCKDQWVTEENEYDRAESIEKVIALDYYLKQGCYILPDEVGRLKKEYCQVVGGNQAEKQQGKNQKTPQEFVSALLAKSEDQDIIAALLKKTYGLSGWDIAKLLNISPHLKGDSRKRNGRKAVARGVKKLASKNEQN